MRSIGVSEELGDYIAAHANPAGDPVGEALAAATVERFGGLATMNIGGDQGRFMSMLVSLMGARTVVEVGTFTGMSALWLARGLPDGGRLVCFDITDKYLATAREAWVAAGVDDRIEVRIGPAADGLAELPDEPHVDVAFIDADKPGYRRYLDLLLPRLTERGVILVDNVLWGGSIIDPSVDDESTLALRAFNDHVATRPDCDAVMLNIGDGVTMIRRRPTAEPAEN
jgi:caffeoyl-CoA O-methyltransferase